MILTCLLADLEMAIFQDLLVADFPERWGGERVRGSCHLEVRVSAGARYIIPVSHQSNIPVIKHQPKLPVIN